jgi:hypothetical protein
MPSLVKLNDSFDGQMTESAQAKPFSSLPTVEKGGASRRVM